MKRFDILSRAFAPIASEVFPCGHTFLDYPVGSGMVKHEGECKYENSRRYH